MILNIINQLKNEPSSNAKIEIIKANKDNSTFAKVLYLTYNKQTRFFVKKFYKLDTQHAQYISLDSVLDILENQLAKRVITGNAAIDKVSELYSKLKEDDQKVLELLLNRDLDCGISATTINKVFPNLIREQPCCKAKENLEENLNKIQYPAILQLKADGSRNLTTFYDVDSTSENENNFDMFTRQSNLYLGLTDLEKSLKTLGLNKEVLDGELIYMEDITKDLLEDISENQQNRQSNNGVLNKTLKNTITDEEQKHIVYVVWDIIPYDVYYGNAPSVETYQERFEKLKELSKRFPNNIKLIPSQYVNSLEEAKQLTNRYISLGLEGGVLKDLKAIWEDSRISGQVKIKAKNTIDLEITGVYPHKKNPNMIGGITGKTSDGKLITNVGSGFVMKDYEVVDGKKQFIDVDKRAENDRSYLFSIQDKLIGMIMEVEFEKITSNKKNDTKNITHGIFKGLRHDKFKANSLDEIITQIESKYTTD